MPSAEAARVVRSVLCRRHTFEQADQILRVMVDVAAEPGTVVIRQGERGQGLLVLVHGAVEVLKHAAGGADVVIAAIEAPTVLGEMSLITDRPASASVRARTACAFRLLSRTQFDRLLQAESIAAYKVVAALAELVAWRLDRMDQKVVELSRPDSPAGPVAELTAFREKLFTEWK
jgi:CRP-like cAMP-binding protein